MSPPPEDKARRFSCLAVWICLVLLVLLLAGNFLWQSSRPYQILERRDGPLAYVVTVRVPPRSTEAQMQEWSSEIKGWSGDKGMINFYDGPPSEQTLLASWEYGTLYPTR